MMPAKRFVSIALLALLAGCGKSGVANPPQSGASGPSSHMPARKAGFWIQTMTHDGKPGRMGEMRMCIDSATDAKLSMIGRQLGKAPCPRTVTRRADGAYSFISTCKMGRAGVITSRGVASGDFSSSYRVHSESDVSGARFGPMNGHHVTDVEGRYLGACPPGMAPGDITISAFKVNLHKLAGIGGALGLE
jgi:hypothetical protein